MIVTHNEQKVITNTSGNEIQFRPTEEGLLHLIDVVANKQYKNPIKSIMIEYTQNSLDSHDEAGKSDVPIEITIPSEEYPYFCVRDFGIGMSNDQVSEIISKIGYSTKNTTQTLRGGFGLGKLVFSSYNTKTMQISNYYDGKRNDWIARLGGGSGGIQPIGSVKTDEPKGLFIKIPVKVEDIDKFRSLSHELYSYIEPKPIIKNYSEHKFILHDVVEENDNWKICKNMGKSGVVTMGGLSFPVEWENIHNTQKEFKRAVSNYSNTHNLVIHFNIGDLDIVSSRDALDYGSEKTQNKLKEVVENIEDYFEKKVDGFSSLNKFEKRKFINNNVLNLKNINLYDYFRTCFNKDVNIKQFLKDNPRLVNGFDPDYKETGIFCDTITIKNKKGSYGREKACTFGDNILDTYRKRHHVFISKTMSIAKAKRLLNVYFTTQFCKGGLNKYEASASFIMARDRETLNKLLDNYAIPNDYIVELLDCESMDRKTSPKKKKINILEKVYTINKSFSPHLERNDFNLLNQEEVNAISNTVNDKEVNLYCTFDFFNTPDFNRNDFLRLMTIAKELGVFSYDFITDLTIYAFNKKSLKRAKEIGLMHVSDYINYIQNKIKEKNVEVLEKYYIHKIRENINTHRFKASYDIRSKFCSIGIKEYTDNENVLYIFSLDSKVKKINLNDLEKYIDKEKKELISNYAKNYVDFFLTKFSSLDYSEIIKNAIKKALA
jgi:hypothetical protein